MNGILPRRLRPAHGWALVWLLSTLATFHLLGRLGEFERYLTNCEAPIGILSYEFAGTADKARTILQAWSEAKVLAIARDSLMLDFLFLLVYPVSLALACRGLSASLAGDLAGVGRWLAWTVLVCAPLDALENLSLLAMLERGADDFLARGAALCAGVKFVLIFAAAGCILASLLAWVRRWLDGRPPPWG